jgi:hypothetical protein
MYINLPQVDGTCLSTRSTKLTASPEELLQVSRSRTHNPSLSQLTGKYWRQATLTDFGKMHNTIDHMVGVSMHHT